MTKFLYSLCFGLLLVGATNCQDNDPEPAPRLEGTWMGKGIYAYTYDQAGNLTSTAGPFGTPSTFKIDILPDSVIFLDADYSGIFYRAYAAGYRKQGDSLVYHDGYSVRIKELTAHTLVLYLKGTLKDIGGRQYRLDNETRYTR
jgi:hypothetical protein